MRPRLAFVTAVVLSVVGAVCAVAAGTPGRDQRVSARPIVLAAASLTEVLPRIEPEARYSFGSSNSLAEQIRRGAPVDVYLSASPAHAQALHRGQLLRKPIAFATNSLVVIVPRSNPANLRSVFDLTKRPKLKLVVAGHKVPIGLYTREVLKRLGLLRVLRKTVSLEPDVKGIVGKVALGQADAGFVYLTDVAPVASRVRSIAIPARAQPTVVYELAIATEPRELAAAHSFVIAVLGPDGRRELRAARFGLP
jgi:molybdate transport system substrate-binding protein